MPAHRPAAGPRARPYRTALSRLLPEWHRPHTAAAPESTVVLGAGVLRVLRVQARGAPVVLLLLEDLHWADPETLTVLDYLADHAPEQRLVCVATSRPGPGPG